MSDKTLIIAHNRSKKGAIFDLCSFDGKIIRSGDLNSEGKKTEIDLQDLPHGRYQLILIEEGEIYRKCIQA